MIKNVGSIDRAARIIVGKPAQGSASLPVLLSGGGLALGELHEVAGGVHGVIDGAAAALFTAGIAARLRGQGVRLEEVLKTRRS